MADQATAGPIPGEDNSAASFRATDLLVAAVSQYIPQLITSDVADLISPRARARLATTEAYGAVEDIFFTASQRARVELRAALVEFIRSIPALNDVFEQASSIWKTGTEEADRDILLRLKYLGLSYQNEGLDKVLDPVKEAIWRDNEDKFPRCLPGTRTSIINNALDELLAPQAPNKPLVLTGGAGTGKSAIASSIVQAAQARRVPICSFICSHAAVGRSQADSIIRTLARQVCRNLRARASIEGVLKGYDDSEGKALSIPQQLDLLLAPREPPVDLRGQPTILLVDALDECENDRSLERLLQNLTNRIPDLCRLYRVILVTRKVDPLSAQLVTNCNVAFDLDDFLDSPETRGAVAAFIDHSLAELRRKYRVPEEWPSQEQKDALNARAAGIFVWAKVAMTFIDDGDDYEEFLDDVLADKDDADDLFDLFRRTLNRALKTFDPNPKRVKKQRFLDTYKAVFGAVLYSAAPCSVEAIAQLASIDLDRAQKQLARLRPLLRPFGGEGQPVQLLHSSVSRFLQHEEAQEYRLTPAEHHRTLAFRSLEILLTGRRFHLAELDGRKSFKSSLNRAKIIEGILEHEQYAALHWQYHASNFKADAELVKGMLEFFDGSFLHWLEIVMIVDTVLVARSICAEIVTLVSVRFCIWAKARLLTPGLQQRLQEKSDLDEDDLDQLEAEAADASQLVLFWDEGIAFSPSQIYLSGLPFAKDFSPLARRYLSKLPHNILPTVWRGASGPASPPDFLLEVTNSQAFFAVGFAEDDTHIYTMTAQGVTYRSLESRQVVRFLRSHYYFGAELSRRIAADLQQSGWVDEDECLPLLFFHPLNQHLSSAWAAYELAGAAGIAVSGDGQHGLVADESQCRRVDLGSFGRPSEGWRGMQFDLRSKEEPSPTPPPSLCRALALSYDGMLSAAALNSALIVHCASDDRTDQIQVDGFEVGALAFAGQQGHLVVGCSDGKLQIRAADDHYCSAQTVLEGHTGRITALAGSRAGIIASAATDWSIRLWSLSDGTCKRVIGGLRGVVETLRLSDDGTKLLVQDDSPSVRVWQVNATEEVSKSTQGLSAIPDLINMAVAPNGKRVALARADYSIAVRVCETEGKVEGQISMDQGNSPSDSLGLQWSADSTRLFTWSPDGRFLRWSIDTAADPTEESTQLSRSSFVATGDLHHVVGVGELEGKPTCLVFTGQARMHAIATHEGACIAIAADGSVFAVSQHGTDAYSVEIRSVAEGQVKRVLPVFGPVAAMTMTPEGTAICAVGLQGQIDVFDVDTGRHAQLGVIDYFSPTCSSVRFDRNGSKILIKCVDESFGVLDATTIAESAPASPTISIGGGDWIRPASSQGSPIWLPAGNRRQRGTLSDLDDAHQVIVFAARDGQLKVVTSPSSDPWKELCRNLQYPAKGSRPKLLERPAVSIRACTFTYPFVPLKDGLMGFAQTRSSSPPRRGPSAADIALARPTHSILTRRPCKIVATSQQAVAAAWFLTEPLSSNHAASIVAARLSTCGKDQGWASDPQAGAWSWYTIRIVDAEGDEKQRWRFTSNKFLSSCYESTATEILDLRDLLAEGDRIAIAVNASFFGWRCDALAGTLHLWINSDADIAPIRLAATEDLDLVGSGPRPRHFTADFRPDQPRLWGRPETVDEADDGSCKTHGMDVDHPCRLTAKGAEPVRKLWFMAVPFDDRVAETARSVRLTTLSRDPGSAAAGGGSWFDVAVLDRDRNVKSRHFSHRNPASTSEYADVEGQMIDVAGAVQSGDSLAVFAVAQEDGARCEGKFATLHLWTQGWD